jgi:hypothetical protein
MVVVVVVVVDMMDEMDEMDEDDDDNGDVDSQAAASLEFFCPDATLCISKLPGFANSHV